MSPRNQLLSLLVGAVAVGSLIDYSIAAWVGFTGDSTAHFHFGAGIHALTVSTIGSSEAAKGEDWKMVATNLVMSVDEVVIAESTPCEWEAAEETEPQADMTIITIDLDKFNEQYVSIHRADYVGFGQTLRDLRNSQADWALKEKTLEQYPLKWVRYLFPTAARGLPTLAGLRMRLQRLIWPLFHMPLPADPNVTTFQVQDARLSDWDRAHVLRVSATLRAKCGGRFSFNGPKCLALERMFRRALARGKVVLVVLPVAPQYLNELATPADLKAFDESLAQLSKSFPAVKFARLDKIPALESADCFSDLLHPNRKGQAIATAELVKQLTPMLSRAP